jgi:hypothetical protein
MYVSDAPHSFVSSIFELLSHLILTLISSCDLFKDRKRHRRTSRQSRSTNSSSSRTRCRANCRRRRRYRRWCYCHCYRCLRRPH